MSAARIWHKGDRVIFRPGQAEVYGEKPGKVYTVLGIRPRKGYKAIWVDLDDRGQPGGTVDSKELRPAPREKIIGTATVVNPKHGIKYFQVGDRVKNITRRDVMRYGSMATVTKVFPDGGVTVRFDDDYSDRHWPFAPKDIRLVSRRLVKGNPVRRGKTAKRSRRNPRAPLQHSYSESGAWKFIQTHAATIAHAKLGGADQHAVRLLALQIRDLAKSMGAQLKAGVHTNPALAVLGNPGSGVAGTIAKRVYEIRYQHAQDGKNYKHPFGPGVRCTLLTDGRAVIWHPSKRVWEDL